MKTVLIDSLNFTEHFFIFSKFIRDSLNEHKFNKEIIFDMVTQEKENTYQIELWNRVLSTTKVVIIFDNKNNTVSTQHWTKNIPGLTGRYLCIEELGTSFISPVHEYRKYSFQNRAMELFLSDKEVKMFVANTLDFSQVFRGN